MDLFKTITRCTPTLLTLAVLTSAQPCAAAVERIVEFSTGTLPNQFAIQGTLNTLAQGLNVVPFGNASAGVQGTLKAKLTIDTGQNPIRLVGVDFLENSFTQGAVSLSYLVPGTSRQVTFNANGVSFLLNLPDIDGPPPTDLAALTIAGAQGGAYNMVQNGGIAEIGITNRPSKQQILSQESVLSSYGSQEPHPLVSIGNFSLTPLAVPGDYEIKFSLPMLNQQVQYTKVGLPVSLNYSGSMQLAGAINVIPEPSTAVIAAGALVLLCGRRRAIR